MLTGHVHAMENKAHFIFFMIGTWLKHTFLGPLFFLFPVLVYILPSEMGRKPKL